MGLDIRNKEGPRKIIYPPLVEQNKAYILSWRVEPKTTWPPNLKFGWWGHEAYIFMFIGYGDGRVDNIIFLGV